MKTLLITVDGPAGAGKTTISRMLANMLHYRYIDTGALYRAVALEAMNAGITTDDDEKLESLCRALELEFVVENGKTRLYSKGLDITEKIRTPEISMKASDFSAVSVVRRYLLEIQRRMGDKKGAVFEGRDMGTVVFPDADLKFFLDASIETRAQRRFEEIKDLHGGLTLEQVEKDMKRRDINDSTRDLSPLKKPQDAIVIDSTGLSLNQVVESMLNAARNILTAKT